MDWFNPALFWFAPLAAIPIVLHLLTLHRLRTVELSTFRFLFDSYVQQRRKMKFLEALLAMLRTLFLLLLLLVCMRPVVKHWSALFGGGSGRDVVMLVDCSASMNARTAGSSALERAKNTAWSVAQKLRRDDRLTLIRVAARPEEIFTRFSADTEAIEEHITGLKASPARGNLFGALSHVFGPGSEDRAKATVYLFTDCQASGWKELSTQDGQRLVPEGSEMLIVNVGTQEPIPNRAIVGTPPRLARAVVGLPLVLRPRVANDSRTETVDVDLRVFIDDKDVARTTMSVKPRDTAEKEIIYVPTEPGVLRGRFEIPEDRFPDDDQYLFTIQVEPQIKVLLVNGNPNADPFEDEVLYLRTALTSSGQEDTPTASAAATASAAPNASAVPSTDGSATPAATGVLAADKQYLRSLDVQEIPESSLNPESLRDASVVILANCGALNDQHFLWLREFVSSGGGLLIFPGDRVNPDIYNNSFFPIPGPQKERMLPVQLGQPLGDAQKFDTFVRFGSIDYAHPVLAVFDDPDSRYLTTSNFYRRFPIQVDDKQANCWTLARFSPREPAVVESRYRDGTILLAAFPATTKWSNLPLKPEFVPLLLRMVHHVEHRAEFEAPSVVPADGSAEIAVAATWGNATGRIVDRHGIPTELEFKRSNTRLMAASDKTDLKGYYTVEVQGGRVEQPKSAGSTFAVNLAAEESQFRTAQEEQIREWLPGVKLSMIDASAEAQQSFGAIGDGREVWRYLLVLMFVVIAIEFMLATVGGRKLDLGEDPTVGERIRQINPGTWVGRMTGAEETAAST